MKRIAATMAFGAVVLGAGGVAVANGLPERPTLGVPAAEPSPGTDRPPAPTAEQRRRLRECVASKAGVDRAEARRRCAEELGLPAPPAGRHHGGKAGRPARSALRGAVHAEAVVPKEGAEGQFETVTVDRGEVTAVDGGSVTLRRPDGPTVKVAVDHETRFAGTVNALGEVKPGMRATVVSAAGTARFVHVARG